jgi:hypothetical protein
VEPSHIAYYNISQYISGFWNLATVIDIVVNLWFSLHFFKQHRIEQTILWATSHSPQMTEQKVVQRLHVAAIGAWTVFLATASFLAYGCTLTNEGMQLVVCLARCVPRCLSVFTALTPGDASKAMHGRLR